MNTPVFDFVGKNCFDTLVYHMIEYTPQ